MLKKVIKKLLPLILIMVFLFLVFYVGLWLVSFKQYPVNFGVNFSPEYARSLGLDWKQVYNYILTDLKPDYIRLSAPWNEIEKEKGQYNYEDIDYLLSRANENSTKVTLVIGQKVPRWPECFFPEWSDNLSLIDREPFLFSYLEETVKRYRNDPALEYWQVENEPFIKFRFGECERFNVDSVQNEVDLVRSLDPDHKIIMTDSGEISLWYRASKTGDILGATLYRVVYSRFGFVWHYSYLPAGLYKFKARILGKDYNNFFISELQAEPWFKNGNALTNSIPKQEKTMNVKSLESIISYTQKVGASRVYFWGVEWWYWMKESKNDSRYWDMGKMVI